MAKTIKEMEEILTFTEAQMVERKLVHRGMHQRDVLNTFRDLRTQLLQKSAERKNSSNRNFVTLVTSVCESGGASFVSTNLATVFALDPNRTALLVDCDIYRAHQDSNLIVGDVGVGMTDYLIEESVDIEEIIYATGVPRLRMIPVGHMIESGAEAFNSERMERFLEHVKSRHSDRYIFVDAPPANTAEARILAQLCDHTLVVVPYGKVTQSHIEAAIDGLGAGTVTGIVFNN